MSKTKSTSLQTVKTAPNTTVIYDRNARIYDANTGNWYDAKDTSQQTQDFMTDLGNYFESLNVSKDVRETTTSFYLGLLGMERNLFELGIKQVMDQIETGAENIDNPLLGGFLGDLGYLEYYAPSLYDYFNDMFGENKTLDRSEVLTNLGIEKDPSDIPEGPSQVERPEGTVNLEELSEEQVGTFWPEIQESLEGLGDAVKQAVFGTSGVPKTPEELLEAIETGVMEGLKGPIAVTFDPEVGVTLDLKIPVGFEVNGNSIQLPIFDKDGNFVLGQSIVDEAGRIYQEIGGTLQEIGNIFTDNEGNVFLDIIDAGQVALGQLGISEEGLLTGVLVEAAIGDFQYDPGTGKIIEEVQASVDDLGLDEGEEDGLADTVDGDGDDGLGLTDITKEESEDKPLTPPKGSKYITDKDGNIVRAIGPDGTIYRVDENGEWSVSTSDVVTEEEETTVLPAETTISNGAEEEVIEEDNTRQEESVEIPLQTVQETELFEEEVIEEDDTRQEESVEIPLQTVQETELTEDTVVITDGDDNGDTDGQPPLTGGDDDETPEEPPLVGPPGADGVDGVDGADGAAGAAGAPGSRGGYMGGLSYQLPQFVGVQYQPKDYTVELNRIINESLFKGMI